MTDARERNTNRAELGRRGEALVARVLEARGFRVLARNARVGRLELDLIARKGSLVVVCEVRARSDARGAHPAETIDHAKLARVRRAAAGWAQDQKLRNVTLRIDAAAVVFGAGEPEVEYYENLGWR